MYCPLSKKIIFYQDLCMAVQSGCILIHTGLVVLRRNFTKLVYCLPHNYKDTLTKIKRTAVVPEGLEHQLAILPTAELANCNILGAMIRPLRKEIHLVGFCDSVENLAVTSESKTFIENFRFGKLQLK